MTKWEYHTETFYVGEPISYSSCQRVDKDGKPLEERFAELGEEGWELVSVTDSYAYFRRKKTYMPVTVGPTEHKLETPSSGPNV